ncbi:hypothetical protein [Mumia sp.]|uniref:hypothetical protein n=1 Tax=Mumia sp. TaxID=1965300 RepID=UPI0026068D72|nr:hypothetical protein [Mumia sp.]MDD9350596.1 hypothetical protein [Mumia sp.]
MRLTVSTVSPRCPATAASGAQHALVADPLHLPIDRHLPAIDHDPVSGHAEHLTDP